MSQLVTTQFNIYCDESCHLENDHLPVMVLGAIWCPLGKVREIAERLREIKAKHNASQKYELKWVGVQPSKLALYLDAIDYFFDDDDIRFRGYVAHKAGLSHDAFKQEHDDWYYKMYFHALSFLLGPDSTYRIYLDIKDTRGGEKVAKLHEVLCNSIRDFNRRIVKDIQIVESRQVEQIQLADVIAGAVAYANRGLETSPAKLAMVNRIKERSRSSLIHSSLMRAEKFNLFHWTPQEGRDA